MSKPRSRAADYAVYLAVRVVVCLLQALSLPAARRLADALAWLAYHADRRHRLVAHDNLSHAFPELAADARRRDALVRAVYRHFCNLLMEMIHLPRALQPTTWKRYLTLPRGRELVAALLSGRPLLFVTAHFGNWEMGGYTLGLLGIASSAIARRLDNSHLDRFLRRFREGTGQAILDKNGDFERIQGVLAGGGVLATLGDQDAGQRGLYVDFFGRPASTHKAVALLALQYRAPMLVIGCPRLAGPLNYAVVLEDVILPEEYEGRRPDAVRAMTERFTAALERLVRRHPEQYFWLHRRWKHQPKAKKAKAAA
jgi:KDO2-lipid IV(A) lauroyltransferase